MSEQAEDSYFALFDLPPSFNLDSADLEKRYFTAQRLCHPDRIAEKSTAGRTRAISLSMRLNQAYEALKSPLGRAQHLLSLQGIHVGGERDSHKPSPALLTEVLESREALAEAQTQDAVEALERHARQTRDKVIGQLSSAFDARNWPEAAELTLQLGYLVKFEDEVRIRKKRFR